MKHFIPRAIGALIVIAACTARADVVSDWNATTDVARFGGSGVTGTL